MVLQLNLLHPRKLRGEERGGVALSVLHMQKKKKKKSRRRLRSESLLEPK